DVALSYFIRLHGNFYALFFAPTLASVLIFVVIPTSVYQKLNDNFCGSTTKFAAKSLSAKLSQDLTRRLFRLSEIFMAIKNAFYTLSAGKVSREQVVCTMVKECSNLVCQSCPNRGVCWRQNLQLTEKALLHIANIALANGKCSILDIPQTLSAKCDKISIIISQVNDLAETHKQFVERANERHTSKLLVADQMSGVSSLLLQIATDYKSTVTFDTSREREIKESLIFHNVLCADVTMLTHANRLLVVVTVAKSDLDQSTIEQCVGLVVKQTMATHKVESTENSRWVNVYLVVKPRFQMTFGVATVAKSGSEISADTHGQIATDNGKNIITLCDGMGSGTKAEKMSSTVINLVESFYRAGFDSDTILSAVNGLLTQSDNEIFCAVDMVIVDMYNGFADFVKLGAPVGFVKCANVVEMIRGSSLPLGVLEEMKPSITKKALHTSDIIVLVSDGIADCYKDVTALAEIVHNITYTTPQSIAETILAKTLKQCNNTPPDDMTVVVAKII
ncbi:MAG: SpoIIE family protein phosphatase, partial [Clostridia bacterium]|nr:SpoIIE family protein phosphatase [Clostridia bacterium]